ncbi:MAG TPA: dTMP kinase [Phycisphaerae bacterium]|nr:dTMP kinase [Phycisphaerae bacterium]HRW52603.1 dTMP kinase [Phycisphaerae bacterium]
MSKEILQRLRGKFIVLDGIDGAGKGAQLDLLETALSSAGVTHVRTRDPGGTTIGDRIRHVLLDYDLSEMDIHCETFLFMASRAQLCRDVIRPSLEEGQVVLGDRYVSATCAYQGAAGYDPQRVIEVARFAVEDVWPDLTIILDMPLDEAYKRTGRAENNGTKPRKGQGQTLLFHDVQTDAMEARPKSFHERVRDLFLELPAIYPRPVVIVDGHGTVEEVHQRILEAIGNAAL